MATIKLGNGDNLSVFEDCSIGGRIIVGMAPTIKTIFAAYCENGR
jgi:hypothetical protein